MGKMDFDIQEFVKFTDKLCEAKAALTDFENKLISINTLMNELLGLYGKMQAVEKFNLLFSVRPVEPKQTEATNPTKPGTPPKPTREELEKLVQKCYLEDKLPLVEIMAATGLTKNEVTAIIDKFGWHKNYKSPISPVPNEPKKQQDPVPIEHISPKHPVRLKKDGTPKKTPISGQWKSPEYDNYIRENHMNMSPNAMGKHLGLSGSTVVYHLNRLGLRDRLADHLGGLQEPA